MQLRGVGFAVASLLIVGSICAVIGTLSLKSVPALLNVAERHPVSLQALALVAGVLIPLLLLLRFLVSRSRTPPRP